MRLSACALLLALAACGPAPLDAEGSRAETLTNGPVSVIDQGHFGRVLACSGQCISQYGFWVDLAVAAGARDKQVGIRWTRDGWRTTNVAYAHFKERFDQTREKWGLDVDLGQATQPPEEVSFAAFAVLDGQESWDPQNDYFVYRKVSDTQPVRVLQSGVAFDPQAGAYLYGQLRTFNIGYEKRVFVRYSTDGWKSSKEVAATWTHGEEWSFRADGLGKTTLPDAVEYAARLVVNGKESWDNNGGQNYRHQLRPRFSLQTGWGEGVPAQVSGIVPLGALFQTDLPVDHTQWRVDTGSWTGGLSPYLDTRALRDGAHALEFQLVTLGGFTATQKVPFTVKNRAQPLERWQLAKPSADAMNAWDLTRGADGRIYVQWDDSRVYRYDAFGQTSAPFAYPVTPYAAAITVDDQQRLYVLASNVAPAVTRYLPTGALDPSFGRAGRIDLSGTFAGKSFCYAGALVTTSAGLHVADTCNQRLVSFDDRGQLTGTLDLSRGSQDIVLALSRSGKDVWVAQATRLLKLGVVRGQLQLSATVPYQGGVHLNGPSAAAVGASGLVWTLEANERLTVLDAKGKLQTSWWGGAGNAVLNVPGELALARAVATLPDGSIAALCANDNTVQRFSGTLK